MTIKGCTTAFSSPPMQTTENVTGLNIHWSTPGEAHESTGIKGIRRTFQEPTATYIRGRLLNVLLCFDTATQTCRSPTREHLWRRPPKDCTRCGRCNAGTIRLQPLPSFWEGRGTRAPARSPAASSSHSCRAYRQSTDTCNRKRMPASGSQNGYTAVQTTRAPTGKYFCLGSLKTEFGAEARAFAAQKCLLSKTKILNSVKTSMLPALPLIEHALKQYQTIFPLTS